MIQGEPDEKSVALQIQLEDREIMIGAKRDLRMDVIRDYRRPKYTYESGRLRFLDVESNADLLVTIKTKKELTYTAVNLTKFIYKDKVLFEGEPTNAFLAFDGSSDGPGVTKVRYWQGKTAE